MPLLATVTSLASRRQGHTEAVEGTISNLSVINFTVSSDFIEIL